MAVERTALIHVLSACTLLLQALEQLQGLDGIASEELMVELRELSEVAMARLDALADSSAA